MRSLFVFAALLIVGCAHEAGDTSSDLSGVADDLGTASDDLASGPQWHAVAAPTDGGVPLRGVWADTKQAVAVGGSSLILHYIGESGGREDVPPGYILRAIAHETGLTAVGDNGAALTQLPDGGWSDISAGGANFSAAWARYPSAVWAVGAAGTLRVNDRSGWKSYSTGLSADLFSIWLRVATIDNSMYVVGRGGLIARTPCCSEPFTTIASGTTNDLFGVWADDNNVFVVGGGGMIMTTTDGAAFTAESSGTAATLYAVSGAEGEVWAVGSGGIILHRHASAWTIEHSGGSDLRAVWAVSSTEAWAVGDASTVLHRR